MNFGDCFLPRATLALSPKLDTIRAIFSQFFQPKKASDSRGGARAGHAREGAAEAWRHGPAPTAPGGARRRGAMMALFVFGLFLPRFEQPQCTDRQSHRCIVSAVCELVYSIGGSR